MPEPGKLALGELPAARLHQRNRCVPIDPPIEMFANFAIAERLGRLPAPRPWQVAQPADLLDEAGRKHRKDAPIDTVVKFGTRQIEPKHRIPVYV